MEIFGDDFMYGDFKASDYMLNLVSFEYDGNSEDEVFSVETTEEFIGENPIATYLGQKYSFHLEGTITLMKNPCQYTDISLSEYECRAVLRKLTGFRGYQWMKFLTKEMGEELWYKARIEKVSLKRIKGTVVGFILELKTDSYFAYSNEYQYSFSIEADKKFEMFINNDDLVNYTYPIVYITPKNDGIFEIIAQNDISLSTNEPYSTRITNVSANNQFKLDGSKKIVDGISLDDFNLHWIRFLPQKNIFIPNMDCDIKFVYRLTRKVGFICR